MERSAPASAGTLRSSREGSPAREEPWSPEVLLVDETANFPERDGGLERHSLSATVASQRVERERASTAAAANPAREPPIHAASLLTPTLDEGLVGGRAGTAHQRDPTGASAEPVQTQTLKRNPELPQQQPDDASFGRRPNADGVLLAGSALDASGGTPLTRETLSDDLNPNSNANVVETQVLFESPLAILKKFSDGHWVDAGRGPVRVMRLVSKSPEQSGTYFRVDSGLRPVLYMNLERDSARTARWEKVRERSVRFLYPVNGQGPMIFVLQLRDASTADILIDLIEQLISREVSSAPAATPTRADPNALVAVADRWAELAPQPAAVLRELQHSALFQATDTGAAFAATLEQLFEAATKTLEFQELAQERLMHQLRIVRQALADTQGAYEELWQRFGERVTVLCSRLTDAASNSKRASSDDSSGSELIEPASHDDPLASMEAFAVEASSEADPEHFLGFCARLASYRSGTFPSLITIEGQALCGGSAPAVQLACQGWVCLVTGSLHCGHCRTTTDTLKGRSFGDKLAGSPQHAPGCPWVTNWSPNTFCSFRTDLVNDSGSVVWAPHLDEAVDYLRRSIDECYLALGQGTGASALELETLASHGWIFVRKRDDLLFACMFCGAHRLIAHDALESTRVPWTRSGHHRPWCAFRDPAVATEIQTRLLASTRPNAT
ncbi:hypothetical protein F1559_004030 [Cyanidiococcus yangmingshanensis]|uniref:Uncharacterized protein n=1 Tax=Cyanidiococcus yangmingshanensis TaxID=2690220 RepID=A0A7J7IH16_9RHOD|nr:hypothetical protein F1559_004030 [Cyanidiococcus yangmingshanensis]